MDPVRDSLGRSLKLSITGISNGMELVLISFSGLIALFVLANFAGFVLKIRSDRFYRLFHFVGGFLIALLLFGLLGRFPGVTLAPLGAGSLILVLTVVIGILWEVYEWLLWKYFLKKKKYKPQRADTINDLVLDFAGAVLAVVVLFSR